jgi:hypothetical protein
VTAVCTADGRSAGDVVSQCTSAFSLCLATEGPFQKIAFHHQLADLGMQFVNLSFTVLRHRPGVLVKRRRHILASRACRHALSGNRCTPCFFDSSASVSSSRIASSATHALKSAEYRVLFVISDRPVFRAIHLNQWSELLRPPLTALLGLAYPAKLDIARVPRDRPA